MSENVFEAWCDRCQNEVPDAVIEGNLFVCQRCKKPPKKRAEANPDIERNSKLVPGHKPKP